MTTQPAVLPSTKRTVLCATDLSHRCDRALDRALLIARSWEAKLVLLTVVNWGDPSAPFGDRLRLSPFELRRAVEQRLRREVVADDVEISFRVAEGPVTQAILHAATEEACDLIVLGTTRNNEAFRRLLLGSTLDSLVRRSPVPVLVVQNRARAPYGSIVVPSDFQTLARRALETAADFFPSAEVAVFHAFDIPYSGIAGAALQKAEFRKRLELESEHGTFVRRSSIAPHVASKVRAVIEYGPPAPLLGEYVLDKEIDLIALGTRGRPALLDFALVGVAQSILEEVKTDVLVVRKGVETRRQLEARGARRG